MNFSIVIPDKNYRHTKLPVKESHFPKRLKWQKVTSAALQIKMFALSLDGDNHFGADFIPACVVVIGLRRNRCGFSDRRYFVLVIENDSRQVFFDSIDRARANVAEDHDAEVIFKVAGEVSHEAGIIPVLLDQVTIESLTHAPPIERIQLKHLFLADGLIPQI